MEINLQAFFKLRLLSSNNGSVFLNDAWYSIAPHERVCVGSHIDGREIGVFYKEFQCRFGVDEFPLQSIHRLRLKLLNICFQLHQLLRIGRRGQGFLCDLLEFIT